MAITTPPNAVHVIPGCAFHVPGFLTAQVADALGARIAEETSSKWKAQLTYNKGWPARVDKGHTMARFGAPGVTYTYKGKPKPMFPFTPALCQALVRVDLALGTAFNCVVVNTYEPGSGLYPHRDGNYIPQLGNTPTIAALSFGTTRTFLLHPADPATNKRIRGAAPTSVELASGDLFVMYGDCDTKYHHSIPEQPDRQGTRISLTFRRHNS
jgi:alkylated DNA repair dioxygenase AlkB